MTNARAPARSPGSMGLTIDTRDAPVVDSPVTPVTPDRCRKELISPPRIRRKARLADPGAIFATPKPTTKGDQRSPCDATQETGPPSQGSPAAVHEPRRKADKGGRGRSAALRSRIERMKKGLPKKTKADRRTKASRRKEEGRPIDLADLAVSTIGIVPRHGAGIASGRTPLERARTSLALHMVRECEGARGSGVPKEGDVKGARDKDGDGDGARVAGLDARLRGCVADGGTCLDEKSQEVVRLAKDALEEFSNGGRSLAKTELGQRNLTCVKFLSGMYREVISDEKRVDSRDGLSLMMVAAAYYALGKFDPALSVYQRAGIELRKRIATSPAHTVHCAKLFNNMGCVYFEMGRHEKAMQTFQRALQLFHDDGDGEDRAAWTAAILDQATIMNNMAYVLIKFKQYDDASDLVEASFELQQILPAGGEARAAMTISSLSTMAFVYYRTRQYKRSLDTYTACVQLQDRSPLCGERDQVELLRKMADICRKIRDHEKRVYLLRTMLVYQQCYLLEDDDEIWDTHAALAETLQAFADSGGTSI